MSPKTTPRAPSVRAGNDAFECEAELRPRSLAAAADYILGNSSRLTSPFEYNSSPSSERRTSTESL